MCASVHMLNATMRCSAFWTPSASTLGLTWKLVTETKLKHHSLILSNRMSLHSATALFLDCQGVGDDVRQRSQFKTAWVNS